MTPSEILTQARAQYNATGDSFFSDLELLNNLWQANKEFARECLLIENIYTTTTVVGQQAYAYPTNTIAVRRVQYDGKRMKRITWRQDDAVTLSNQTSVSTGTPIYYTDWNFTIYCRPIPDDTRTLEIFTYNDPAQITLTSSLEIPTLFHMDCVDYVVAMMFAKDQNSQMCGFHMLRFEKHVSDAKRWKKKLMRTDSFATVQDEGSLPVTILGEA